MEKVKAGFVFMFTAINAWLGVLAIPVYILVALNIGDYITGMIAAPKRGEARKSEIAFEGIVKKVCKWVIVAIGAAMDWLLGYAAGAVGISLPVHSVVASLTAIWLIADEIVSILENMADIGVALPPFLMVMAKWVKAGAAEAGESTIKKAAEKSREATKNE
jgi:toxin secretion/phage lysis holin